MLGNGRRQSDYLPARELLTAVSKLEVRIATVRDLSGKKGEAQLGAVVTASIVSRRSDTPSD